MKRASQPIGLLLLLFATAILAACSDDRDAASDRMTTRLHIASCRQPFEYVDAAPTRSLPTGYTKVSPVLGDAIELFMTSGGTMIPGTFTYLLNAEMYYEWHSTMEIVASRSYKVYGYIPKAGSGHIVEPYNGLFDNGVRMTLNGLTPLVTNDPCVITGVMQGVPAGNIEDTDIRRGAFDYIGRSSSDGNYIYLLLDHIYAGLDFEFRVNEGYSALRKIKLKSLKLKTTKANSVNATIVIAANENGSNPINSVDWTVNSGNQEAVVYNNAVGQWLTTSYEKLADAEFAPVFTDADYLNITCTYDVYTADGSTLVSLNRTAENRLSGLGGLLHGQKRTVKISVNPTYLYVLADPDAADPVFTIE